MKALKDTKFHKYDDRGGFHWKEIYTRDIRRYNAYQAARYELIIQNAGDVQGKKILDLGCGDGLLTYLLAKKGAHMYGIDGEENGIRCAKECIKARDPQGLLTYSFAVGSVYTLPFEPETFDVIVSCEVIEHLTDPDAMLTEATRVLKKGGKIILTTPHRLTETPVDPHHVHEYFPQELEQTLKRFFGSVTVTQTHHMLWRALYGYAFAWCGGREIGRWGINALTLWFGWNPFTRMYTSPKKFDLFSSLLAVGVKQ